jgi:hypothetical protein
LLHPTPSIKEPRYRVKAKPPQNFLTHHTISPDGYNLGRDLLVARATTTRTVFKGVRYATSVRRLEGLLGVGKEGCVFFGSYSFLLIPMSLDSYSSLSS